MNFKVRRFAWLPLFFIIAACSTSLPSPQSTDTGTEVIITKPVGRTATIHPPDTPFPSPTRTPYISSPTITPTQTSTLAPTPTSIPREMQLSIFENLWTVVNDTYLYPDFNGLDWNQIKVEYSQKITSGLTNEQFYQSMHEVINRLGDDHSHFLDPQEVADEEAEYKGSLNYVGIGVLVSPIPERKHAVILSVFPGSPAEGVGLKPRDSIISVDGEPILDQNGILQDIVRGPEGTTITITVQTPGDSPRDVRVTRHLITGAVPVVHMVINKPGGLRIGYILLVTFNDSTVDEQVESALRQMSAEAPLDGLILDNRMNGGGSSTVVEPILGYFAGGNLGYFIKRNEERAIQIKNNDINGSSQVPLVVLIGAGTVSFGEIFSGILQDIGRAYLIGQTTDGIVEVEWRYDLEDGSRLWLANETFRPLNHPDQDWEETGITPDIAVQGDFDEYTFENDPVVLAAIQYLSNR